MKQKAAQIGKPNAARDISKIAEDLIRESEEKNSGIIL
jgi:hypothetical protein